MGFSRQEYWSGVPSPSPETTDDVKRVRPEADSYRETSVGIPTVQWSNTSNPARAITSLPESVHRAQLSPKNKKWKQLQINRGPMKLWNSFKIVNLHCDKARKRLILSEVSKELFPLEPLHLQILI